MQFFGQGKPPIGVVFDADMGAGVQDALALAMLYALEGKNESRIISTSITRGSLHAAAYCDAIGRFLMGPPPQVPPGAFAFQRPIPPIGMGDAGKMAEDTPVVKAVLEKKTAEGKPAYPQTIKQYNDTADPVALIRNALSAQNDENALIVLAGPATNLVKMMELPGSKDLIKRKVKFLTVAAGSYPDGRPDAQLKADLSAARKLFAEWPTPIVAAGSEVGDALPFPGASIDKDFSWAPNHPLVDAYRAFQTMPYDAPAPAMAAVLYTVRSEGYFKLSSPGVIAVQDDGRTRFTPSSEGRHRYLVVDPAQKEKVLQAYVELASAKPVPRAPRMRGGQKKAAEPPKKQ